MEVKVGEQVIHYEMVHSDGDVPVIILHGWGHSGTLWQPVAQLLPERYRCYLVDLPGFGHSPIGNKVLTVDDYATIVVEFIKKLDLHNIILVGHSFGGQVAVRANSKEILKRVLVAPALLRQRSVFNQGWYSFLRILAKGKRFLPLSWRYHASPGMDYASASPIMKQVFKNLIVHDVGQLLPQLQSPTLLIWGENDHEILGKAAEIAALIPDCRLKIMYDAGHNLHLEKPVELSRLMERWI